jgi:hypothetical protein
MGTKKNAHSNFVGKQYGKESLGKPRRRWEYIKMSLGEIGWDGTDWILVTQDRGQWRALVHTEMNLRVP